MLKLLIDCYDFFNVCNEINTYKHLDVYIVPNLPVHNTSPKKSIQINFCRATLRTSTMSIQCQRFGGSPSRQCQTTIMFHWQAHLTFVAFNTDKEARELDNLCPYNHIWSPSTLQPPTALLIYLYVKNTALTEPYRVVFVGDTSGGKGEFQQIIT